jgi:glutamine amidotransferase-like uncharacterized protein
MGRVALLLVSLVMSVSCHLHSPPASSALNVPDDNPGTDHTDVLLYTGEGSWGDEIDSLKQILFAHGKTYEEMDDGDFNALDADDLKMYSMVLFAGGDSDKVSAQLNPEIRSLLRKAVKEKGLNYLGFCAGAWLVVSPEPKPEEEDYGFHLIDGPWLDQTSFYNQGRKSAIANALFPDGRRRNLLWFGGPVTPDVPGGVIAKYPDGKPAITQLQAGKGFVIISGLHPAANKKILSKIHLFTKAPIAPDLGWTMLDAAIRGKPMAAFSE